MINRLLAPIINPRRYHGNIQRYIVYIVLLDLVVVYTLFALIVREWVFPPVEFNLAAVPGVRFLLDVATRDWTLMETAIAFPQSAPGVIMALFYVLCIVAYVINRQGWVRIARWLPLFLWYIAGVFLSVISTPEANDTGGAIILLLVMGGLLAGWRGIVISTVLSLATLLMRASTNAMFADSAISLQNTLIQIAGGSVLVFLFLRFARLSTREAVTEAVEDRAATADLLSEIAVLVAQRASLASLLDAIVNRTVSRFDFIYHAQIFMVEENGYEARLVASTGPVGQQLIARGHLLKVGSMSVIGQVTLLGKPIIARSDSPDSVHRRNELLPETQVEAAFPLRIGDRIIGALDLQSRTAVAFDDPNLIATFQALADSTALAIDNVAQYENARERLAENEKLVEQTRTALREVERLNERLTGRAWAEYLRRLNDEVSVTIDFEAEDNQPHADWTPTLREAARINHLVQEVHQDRQVIAVPLRVRGQVIGAMEFELDDSRPFTPEDLDLVQEVSERFGLAAENARLVDESQRLAQREALVNQISQRLQTNINVEATLAEAVRSLRDTLKAERVAIRLGTPPAVKMPTEG
jgi:GAF domain-containing protein